MKTKSRHAQFLSSLDAIGCDVENLNKLSTDHELPKKLLHFVSGGKTGFTRSKSGDGSTFTRTDFYRALHH